MRKEKMLAPCPVNQVQFEWIKKEAERLGCSQNEVVRRLIEAARNGN